MDASNCAEPACSTKAAAFKHLVFGQGSSSSTGGKSPPGGAKGAAAVVSSGAGGGNGGVGELSRTCPADREELGRAGWTLLHTTAAYYPEEPSSADKHAAIGLVESVAQLYPCGHCRESFAEDLKECPPVVDTREDFSIWLCKQHNRVNESLGKPAFECTLAALQRRWRTGDVRCQELYASAGTGLEH